MGSTPWSFGKGLYIAARYYGASVVLYVFPFNFTFLLTRRSSVEAYCAFTCSFVGVLAQLAIGAVNVTVHHSIPVSVRLSSILAILLLARRTTEMLSLDAHWLTSIQMQVLRRLRNPQV